jgi:Zn-dependent protease
MRNLIPTTEAANRVIGHAQREAQRLDHSQIDPAHLLLGLAMDTEGSGYRLLTSFGIDPKKLRLSIEQNLEPGEPLDEVAIEMSPRARRVLKTAESEAQSFEQFGVDGEHILLALMRERAELPYKLLTESGMTYDKLRAKVDQMMAGKRMAQNATRAIGRVSDTLNRSGVRRVPIKPSPIFLAICAATAIFAALMYFRILPQVALIFFIIGGWVISLCLHEFGHAFVAYIGGDHEVYNKGYLTLNPLKYTHPLLSIVLPLAFLLIGGLGLPGGAVYINRHVIRGRHMHSLISAAGPIANLICAIILFIPFVTGLAYNNLNAHLEFWAAVGFLAALQIFSILLNLLPIPGLDGFGILSPYLPDHIVQRLMPLYRWGFIILLVIFLSPLGSVFWSVVMGICSIFNLDPSLAFTGSSLFRFWA